MGSTPNTILSLATRAFERGLSLDAVLRDHVPTLIRKGIPLNDLIDAQIEAFNPERPPVLRSYIAKICAEILVKGSPGGMSASSLPQALASVLDPSAIHLAVAESLSESQDRKSLQLATEHYRAARRGREPTAEDYNGLLMHEGDARRRLAELGVDPLYNLKLAIEYPQQARFYFPPNSRNFGIAEMNEGIALDVLANLGVNPREHLESAIRLYRHARSVFLTGTEDFASTQFNEAASCVYLGDLGVDPIQLFSRAISLCESAREALSDPSRGFGLTLLNEGQARRGLAEWGERPIDNLRSAVIIFHQAQTQFTSQEYDWCLAVAGEAGALRELADRGLDASFNLNTALGLIMTLRQLYVPGTLPHAEQNVRAADLHIALARCGVQPGANLNAAIKLCEEARQGFDPTGQTHCHGLTSEGHARLLQAELGIRPKKNCQLALALYEQSETGFAPGSSNWAVARRNSSRALWRLGLFAEAYERLTSGLAVLDVSRHRLGTERERIEFAQSISGQYQDAAAICLDAMAHVTNDEMKNHWLRESWHQVHMAKNRALLDLLQGTTPRLRDHERALWENLESLFNDRDDCEREIRDLHKKLRAGKPTNLLQRLNELNATLSKLTADIETKRSQVLKEIEGADTFLGVGVPPVDDLQTELHRLAQQRAGPGRRSLLVEFFLLDTGEILVFLAPLWGQRVLEVQRIPLPPGLVRRLATDLMAALDAAIRNDMQVILKGALSNGSLQRLLDEMAVFVDPWVPFLDRWQPTELIISPHSVLNLLPIHAAPFRGGRLIERFPITYLPSPALAKHLSRKVAHDLDSALMIGNPVGDLGEAELEVRHVAEQFTVAGCEVQCFTGDQATTECIHTHASHVSVIHLACHSELNHDDFPRSGFLLSDRRMTVLEVMATLDLSRASLVYLSSCDSAQPVVGHTEELMALARSFLYAGSPTVIASLWPLNDAAGRVFAESFYSAWLSQQNSLAQSFQSAMLRTREAQPDPMFWAPFVMIGAW